MAYIIAKKNNKNGKVTVLTVNNVFVPIDEDKEHVCKGFTDINEANKVKEKYDKEYPHDVIAVGIYQQGLVDPGQVFKDYFEKK